MCTFHSTEYLTILLIYCDVYYVRFHAADKSEELSLHQQQVALYCNTVCMIHIKIAYITIIKERKGSSQCVLLNNLIQTETQRQLTSLTLTTNNKKVAYKSLSNVTRMLIQGSLHTHWQLKQLIVLLQKQNNKNAKLPSTSKCYKLRP